MFLSELSTSLKSDLWSIHSQRIFPLIRPRTLPNPSLIFKENSLRVIFVRHPLERLASAYTDKISPLTNEPFSLYDRIRRFLCRRYSSFYLTRDEENLYRKNSNLERQIDEPCGKIVPTFEHFIRFMVFDRIQDDVHWKPYSKLCHACLLNYNFVGKFETMKDDLIRLIEYLGLDVHQWIKEDYLRTGKSQRNYQIMYSNFDEKTLCYLKYFYKDDLKLFDYRFEEYLQRNRTIQCSLK